MNGQGLELPELLRVGSGSWELRYSYSRQRGGKRGGTPGLNSLEFRAAAAASAPEALVCWRVRLRIRQSDDGVFLQDEAKNGHNPR